MNQDFDCCQKDTKNITDRLDQLSFKINQEQSVLIPNQKIVFFGVIIDIVEFKVYLTTENIDKIKNLYVPILEKQTGSISYRINSPCFYCCYIWTIILQKFRKG